MDFSPPRTYTYADIGLVPTEFSTVVSRDNVDTTTDFLGLLLELPVLLAPMETVVGPKAAMAAAEYGMLAFMPRRAYNYQQDTDDFSLLMKKEISAVPCVPAGDELTRLVRFYRDVGAWAVCIDVANAYHVAVEDAVKRIRDIDEDIYIITGNIASKEAYEWCTEAGIDAVRVGIGGGSVCSTSIATGVGVGQASLVRQLAELKDNWYSDDGPLIIADGGIKTPGDIAKAIALGADVVMAGGMFAGTAEAPGDLIEKDGRLYKELAGQASMGVKREKRYVEGVKTLVPANGPIKDIAENIEDGLRSAMAYMNAHELDDMRFLPDENFVGLSNEAKRERAPHANI